MPAVVVMQRLALLQLPRSSIAVVQLGWSVQSHLALVACLSGGAMIQCDLVVICCDLWCGLCALALQCAGVISSFQSKGSALDLGGYALGFAVQNCA
jgi:hypothetical protein